jgi:hypothetical protein
MNAMPALSKFLVLWALVLSASHANAFTSLSSVAGKHVWINHLTQLQQAMSNSTNEPSREPISEPTKRMDLNAVLPNNLTQLNNAVLSNHSNQQESLANQPGIDEEINYPIAASNSSQPTPINLDSSGLRRSSRTEVLNRCGLVMDHDERLTSPLTTHLRSASQQSFSSARVPFSNICPFGGLSCGVQSLAVKVQASSTTTVSCHAFTLFAFESISSTKQISSPNTALKATAEMHLSADNSQDPGPLVEQPIAATDSSQYNLPKVSCNTFASLVCEPVTSTNQINQDKSSAMFKLVVASVSNNNALSFNDKSSSTFKLVVASITNEFSKGQTIDSPAKQRSVPNDDPAIESSLQLYIPMIIASIRQLIVALTFERSIKALPIFQLIDVSVHNKNDSCSVFQIVAQGHNTFIESTSFNDDSFQLVVK